ncbi:MAG: 50S ribosomal protein L4 [Spirochaetaceae bacterium]|jgi:large subunit ribosomal protein L4|nr:50S ribosomal protein L4 [Spirochaetaceae bacterium]
MEVKVYSIDGKESKSLKLEDSVFGIEVSQGSIYNAIRNELANKRVGTASVKGRSEVRGSGAKPWRQKGTGRARAGHKRSPIWRGGGVAFGPTPRDYSYSLPKKVKRLAFKSILSLKAQDENRFKVVEDFTVDTGKTKDLAGILKNLVSNERTVMILKDDDKMVRRAGKNIPNLDILSYNRLNAHDLFYGKNVLVLESAALQLNQFYGS